MTKILLLLFISLSVCSVAQTDLDMSKYRVDTVIKASEDYPNTFDTIITYQKIKIIHEKLVVIDSINRGSFTTCLVNFGAIYQTKIEHRNIKLQQYGIQAGFSANIKRYNIGLDIGVNQYRFRQQYNTSEELISTTQKTISDTVDIYYVQETDDTYSPRYIIKDREVTVPDTSITSTNFNNTFNLYTLNTRIFAGRKFLLNKWKLGIAFGYNFNIPLSKQSNVRMINKEEKQEIVQTQNQYLIDVEGQIYRTLFSRVDLYMNLRYTYQLNPLLVNEKSTYQMLGGAIGVQVSI